MSSIDPPGANEAVSDLHNPTMPGVLIYEYTPRTSPTSWSTAPQRMGCFRGRRLLQRKEPGSISIWRGLSRGRN
jgi:hypothetical protein